MFFHCTVVANFSYEWGVFIVTSWFYHLESKYFFWPVGGGHRQRWYCFGLICYSVILPRTLNVTFSVFKEWNLKLKTFWSYGTNWKFGRYPFVWGKAFLLKLLTVRNTFFNQVTNFGGFSFVILVDTLNEKDNKVNIICNLRHMVKRVKNNFISEKWGKV